MDNDLSDVGLNALEAMENADEKAENTEETTPESPENTGEEVEKDTTETEEPKGSDGESSEEKEEDEPDNDGSDAGEDGEGGTDDSKSEDTEDKKEPEKKELSDEEFEELAKKRGYAKAPSEEDKAKENARAEANAKLLAKPKEVDEEVWDSLPEQNKIIYNALPYIEAEGKDGVVMVKTPDQLPDDFEFASPKASMKFNNELQAQENRATEMANVLSARAERAERAEAERAEAQKVVSEIEGLQKSGELPKPKANVGSAEFDNDPAVLVINKVLGYRSERMANGYNLSVADALKLYKLDHPEEFEKKEAKGDKERANVAKKIAGGSKASGKAVNDDADKPNYYKTGMSTEDVLDRILDDMD